MKKTGIFGGSFNPPHTGHLLIAQEALSQLNLDCIIWIPAKKPPHKQLGGNASDLDRAEMVRLAIEENENFHLSLIEFEREGASYTIDTVKHLLSIDPDQQLTFIMGGDMVHSLGTWKGIDELRELVSFAGVRRKDSPVDESWEEYKVKRVDVPLLEISSTFIRKRRQSGGNVRYFIPKKVLQYIEEKGLYGQN
jgi:nicotinate-nucleotide adenylyltransferase